MPSTYTFPGVYVEEIPSGVRTITGVSTSDTAFIDFFPRGPVDEAVRITSFGDFARLFGGLHSWSEASYAIQQYYLNGGQIAWVVRVVPADAAKSELILTGGSPVEDVLTVTAKNEGAWGDNLEVAVVDAGNGRFNLVVREAVVVNGRTQIVNTETHRNLTMDRTDSRYVVRQVNSASSLVDITDTSLGVPPLSLAPDPSSPDGVPAGAFTSLEGGSDGTLYDSDGDLVDDTVRAAFAALLQGNEADKSGMRALDVIDPFVFNILCIPAASKLDADPTASIANMAQVVAAAQSYVEGKRAFFIMDIPEGIDTPKRMIDMMEASNLRHRNAATYFPRLVLSDPLAGNRPRNVGPSGTLAGVYARTDANRGIWKAPAGTDATLRGASLAVKLTDLENGSLNPLGINAERNFPIFGNVSWGARTLEGADQQASEWKYIPVRRTALYIEESLYQGLKWVVFEPNDEPLWAQVRLNVGAFMQNLFRQGAFQGKTPREAYFVKCDRETTTQDDINRGIVNILVGFAPLKPAEFVVIKLQQMAGQIEA